MITTALGLGALVGAKTVAVSGQQPPAAPAKFNHRGYLGWITDLASDPDRSAAWPSMRLDAKLLKDYQESFVAMRRLGFNEISVWGLYVSRSWPVDIAGSVSRARGALVEKLIDAAHRQGIRVYSGLGLQLGVRRHHPG